MAAAWLQAVRGRTEQARGLAVPLADEDGIPATHVLTGELLRCMGEPGLALRMLERVGSGPRPEYVQCQLLVTTALMEAAVDRTDSAHRYLERALDVAEAEGLLHAFMGEDPLLADLLADHPRHGTRHDATLGEIAVRRDRARSNSLELLTPREQELFQYLRTAMTTQEIADDLHLSLNTVKTHFRSIYRKLGVTNRRSAVKLLS